MNRATRVQLAGAAVLLLASAALALHGQPTPEQKWNYMAPKYQHLLTDRKVYIDPAELLSLMNDDYIQLVIYDVRNESDWNLFHLVDSELVSLDSLETRRDRLLAMPESAVVVVVSNDEMLATEAWKRLMVIAKPNAYILEGGLNHWLDIYGVPGDEHDGHGRAAGLAPDGTMRHPFTQALGDRHAAAQPDEHHLPVREYERRVRLLKKIARAGGCD
jgi:rhodanese-related sulfurtransferase